MKRLRVVTLAATALLGSWTPAQTRPFDRTRLARPITRVPLTRQDDSSITVEVHVGEDGPYAFALDLGDSSDGTLDRGLARRLKLLKKRAGGTRPPVAAVREVRAAGATFTGLDLRIVEIDEGAPHQGTLGSRVFRDVLVQLDPSRDHLVLYRGALPGEDSRQLPPRETTPSATAVVTLDVGSGRKHLSRPHDPREPRPAHFDPEHPDSLAVRRTNSGHLLVQPFIDGRDLGWFVFDTGASTTTISNRVAAGADLVIVGKGHTVSQTRAHRTAIWAAESLRLGAMTIPRPRMTGLDIDEMSRHVGNAAGVLGGDVLQHCLVELDLLSSSLRIHDPREFVLEGVAWHELELSKNVPIVGAAFERHEGSFLLDTGDPGAATFFAPTVRRFDLLDGRELVKVYHAGVGGGFELSSGWIGSITLGGQRLTNPPASVATSTAGMLGSDLASGSIGCAVLDRFTVILDYGGNRVAFLRPDPFEVGAKTLNGHAGSYERRDTPRCVVHAEGDQLLLEIDNRGPAQELIAESEDDYRVPYGLGTCRFSRNAAGETTHVTLSWPGQPLIRLSRQQ